MSDKTRKSDRSHRSPPLIDQLLEFSNELAEIEYELNNSQYLPSEAIPQWRNADLDPTKRARIIAELEAERIRHRTGAEHAAVVMSLLCMVPFIFTTVPQAVEDDILIMRLEAITQAMMDGLLKLIPDIQEGPNYEAISVRMIDAFIALVKYDFEMTHEYILMIELVVRAIRLNESITETFHYPSMIATLTRCIDFNQLRGLSEDEDEAEADEAEAEEDIDNLPKRLVKESKNCDWCDRSMQNTRALTLPCNHRYHKECISGWLIHEGNCSRCKKHISERVQHLYARRRERLQQHINYSRTLVYKSFEKGAPPKNFVKWPLQTSMLAYSLSFPPRVQDRYSPAAGSTAENTGNTSSYPLTSTPDKDPDSSAFSRPLAMSLPFAGDSETHRVKLPITGPQNLGTFAEGNGRSSPKRTRTPPGKTTNKGSQETSKSGDDPYPITINSFRRRVLPHPDPENASGADQTPTRGRSPPSTHQSRPTSLSFAVQGKSSRKVRKRSAPSSLKSGRILSETIVISDSESTKSTSKTPQNTKTSVQVSPERSGDQGGSGTSPKRKGDDSIESVHKSKVPKDSKSSRSGEPQWSDVHVFRASELQVDGAPKDHGGIGSGQKFQFDGPSNSHGSYPWIQRFQFDRPSNGHEGIDSGQRATDKPPSPSSEHGGNESDDTALYDLQSKISYDNFYSAENMQSEESIGFGEASQASLLSVATDDGNGTGGYDSTRDDDMESEKSIGFGEDSLASSMASLHEAEKNNASEESEVLEFGSHNPFEPVSDVETRMKLLELQEKSKRQQKSSVEERRTSGSTDKTNQTPEKQVKEPVIIIPDSPEEKEASCSPEPSQSFENPEKTIDSDSPHGFPPPPSSDIIFDAERDQNFDRKNRGAELRDRIASIARVSIKGLSKFGRSAAALVGNDRGTVQMDGITVPVGGITVPVDGNTVQLDGITVPVGGITVPEDGNTVQLGGITVPVGGITIPEDGNTVQVNTDTFPLNRDTARMNKRTVQMNRNAVQADENTDQADGKKNKNTNMNRNKNRHKKKNNRKSGKKKARKNTKGGRRQQPSD